MFVFCVRRVATCRARVSWRHPFVPETLNPETLNPQTLNPKPATVLAGA